MKDNKKDIKKRPEKNEIVKGKIANALTSAAKNHIVATTDDIYDTNFLEYQDEINKRILDLIPEEASPENQLADKEYVDNAIEENTGVIEGSYSNWTSVPPVASGYTTIPKANDYIIVQDASDYPKEHLIGTWKFVYQGEWETEGKEGWTYEYQVDENPETDINFYWKYEGDDDYDATFITKISVTITNTVLSYPQLTGEEFKDGGYWDVPITDLRNVTASSGETEIRVTYIVPISYDEDNFASQQLNELCYENGWCNSPDYITLEEMENLTTTEN